MSNDPRERFKALAKAENRPWFAVENKANDTARIDIYDFIDPWGVTAQDFVKSLNEIKAKSIELHINSPGGDVFDAVAIYHALVDHPATVNVIIDGMAASAASFIAQAGSSIVMNTYAEMMIHEASAFAWGNASDLEETAKFLDRQSEKIANIYADRSGATASSWREAMKAETWYSAQEAVDAGLADSVKPPQKKAGDKGDDEKSKVENRFDLSAYNYAGRSNAPPPTRINAKREIANSFLTVSNSVDSNATEVSTVTPDQLEALGLSEGASDTDVLNAIKSLKASASETPDAEPETEQEPKPEKTEESTTTVETTEKKTEPVETPDVSNSFEIPKGLTAVDTQAFNAMQERLAKVEAENAAAKQREHVAARNAAITAAVNAGKIDPASRSTYEEMYDLDSSKAKNILDKLPVTLPTQEIGHSEQPTDLVDDLSYPTAHLTEAERQAIAARNAAQGA